MKQDEAKLEVQEHPTGMWEKITFECHLVKQIMYVLDPW